MDLKNLCTAEDYKKDFETMFGDGSLKQPNHQVYEKLYEALKKKDEYLEKRNQITDSDINILAFIVEFIFFCIVIIIVIFIAFVDLMLSFY